MNFDGTHTNALGLMRAALGQDAEILPAELPAEIPAAEVPSYQEVFNRLFSTCVGMVGPEECHKLLGYRPFICPTVPITQTWYFWLGVGVVGGALVGKFLA